MTLDTRYRHADIPHGLLVHKRPARTTSDRLLDWLVAVSIGAAVGFVVVAVAQVVSG